MKILLITLHIFPIQTPRALRSTELIKELARRGHKVTVYAVLGKFDYSDFLSKYPSITLKNFKPYLQFRSYNSDGNYKGHIVDKGLRWFFSKLFEFPYIEYYFRLPRILKEESKHDVLISVADPHPIHWGCSKARIKNPDKFPPVWIADCGDPFMDNGRTTQHYPFYSRFEKTFCDACDFITVPHLKAKEGYYPEYRNKIHVIPQGFKFDRIIIQHQPPVNNKILTYAYAGVFLKDVRNPDKFLNYLTQLNKDFRFVVYTEYDKLIAPFKEKLGNKLQINRSVPREELLKELSKMDFLVNLENVNLPTAIPSKLIDYAIVGRPILSINPASPDYRTIDEFLNGDYSNRFVVENLEQYHIENVVDQFEALFKK